MMRYCKVGLFLLSIFILSCSTTKSRKEIEVAVNKNVETVMILFSQVSESTNQVFASQIPPLLKTSMAYFSKYKDHPSCRVMDEMGSQRWLDGMVGIAVRFSPVPHARTLFPFPDDFTRTYSKSENLDEAHDLIDRFIASLNSFYVDADVEGFLDEHRIVYEGLLDEVRKNLPPEHFISTMETYYGEEKAGFFLVPSPLLYTGIGFGPQAETDEGFRIFNVFGPRIHLEAVSDSIFGFDDAEEIERLSVHEFGHSFVNPLVDMPANKSIVDGYEYLLEPIRTPMSKLGYKDWNTVVKEHIVRLGEIRIALAMGDKERADRLRDYHINNRKFVYLPTLEKSIRSYEQNRDQYPALADYFPVLLNTFGEISVDDVSQ